MENKIFNLTKKQIHIVDKDGNVLKTYNPLNHILIELRDLSSEQKIDNVLIKHRELSHKNIFLYNKNNYYIVELESALLYKDLDNLLIVSKEDIYMISNNRQEYYVSSLTKLNFKNRKL